MAAHLHARPSIGHQESCDLDSLVVVLDSELARHAQGKGQTDLMTRGGQDRMPPEAAAHAHHQIQSPSDGGAPAPAAAKGGI